MSSKDKSIYIYSTLAAPVRYESHTKGGGDIPTVASSVLINGGAGVADKHFITPRGVVTPVTEEEFAALQENDLFKLHVTNGYITHEKKQKSVEDAVADMEARDVSDPVQPADYIAEGIEPPTTAGETVVNKGGRPAKASK